MERIKLYAGYQADGSYRPIQRLAFLEADGCRNEKGNLLTEHCDIFEKSLMRRIVDALGRPWDIGHVDEMWVSNMPGTKALAVSLVAGGRPFNYPIEGHEAIRVFNLVNLMAEEERQGEQIL